MKCNCCDTTIFVARVFTFDGGETTIDLCDVCVITCRDLMRTKGVTFGTAYKYLKAELEDKAVEASLILYDEEAGDETMDIVRVNHEPITHEEYQELEYELDGIYIPNPFFENRKDQLGWLRELWYIALIGGDAEWKMNLEAQIKRVKERQNNDTI